MMGTEGMIANPSIQFRGFGRYMLALKMGPRSRGPGEFRVLVMRFCGVWCTWLVCIWVDLMRFRLKVNIAGLTLLVSQHFSVC